MNGMESGDVAVTLDVQGASVRGDLRLPTAARGLVLFAHGSGSSRHSPRNRRVARQLLEAGIATLLIDLLSEEEGRVDEVTREFRFDIDLLARRLAGPLAWLRRQPETRSLPMGLFGASTGAAAALIACAEHPGAVGAVVSRGGRPDLAGSALDRVRVPTLLIVGGHDPVVLDLNEQARRRLPATARLEVVPGAGHLFDGPGQLDRVAALARAWFLRHLAAVSEAPAPPAAAR